MSGDRTMHEVGGAGPLRLDGKQLCMGCEEAFVVEGYCAECTRLAAAYAAKEAAEMRTRLRVVPRVDVGTVRFVADPPTNLFTFRQYCAGFAILAFGLAIWGFGLWSLGRAVLGFVLRHG